MRYAILLFAIFLFSEATFAQYIVEIEPLKISNTNSFNIAQVEDLRSDKTNIGFVKVGPANKLKPASFNKAFTDFVNEYLNNAIVATESPMPINIKVHQFNISEKTMPFNEKGKIEATFEATFNKEGQEMVLLKNKFYYEESALDVTKKHPLNIYMVFRKLLNAVDSALNNIDSIQTKAVTYRDDLPILKEGITIKKTDEINLKTPEKILDVNDYGGIVALGVAIGGGGLLGIPISIYPTRKVAIKLGVYYRPFLYSETRNVTIIDNGVMFAGGFNFYINERIDSYKRLRMSGITLKGGYSIGNFPEAFGAMGWASEKFYLGGRSFSTELGIGIIALINSDYSVVYPLTSDIFQPFLYFKLHWAWFVAKRSPAKN